MIDRAGGDASNRRVRAKAPALKRLAPRGTQARCPDRGPQSPYDGRPPEPTVGERCGELVRPIPGMSLPTLTSVACAQSNIYERMVD